jgi:hypothetical protein
MSGLTKVGVQIQIPSSNMYLFDFDSQTSPHVVNPVFGKRLFERLDTTFVGARAEPEGTIKAAVQTIVDSWLQCLRRLEVFHGMRRLGVFRGTSSVRCYTQGQDPLVRFTVSVRSVESKLDYTILFDEDDFFNAFGIRPNEYFQRSEAVGVNVAQCIDDQAMLREEIARLQSELALRERQYKEAFITPLRNQVASFTLV